MLGTGLEEIETALPSRMYPEPRRMSHPSRPSFVDLLAWRARYAAGESLAEIAAADRVSPAVVAWACLGTDTPSRRAGTWSVGNR
ncbi:hypothetical protein tb265_39190 [Gemmatimonadetes bacterium T265]|nr:hypothetical protein tb265_39190 [Gemmatimonadetes bacterium T265]